MKAIHAFFVLFLIGFTVSCASIYGVKYDYDQQANFADLKTFEISLFIVVILYTVNGGTADNKTH